jgi:hypothetical protein
MGHRWAKAGRLAGSATAVASGMVGLNLCHPARGALVITAASGGIETVNNGTYDIVDYYLTGLTGADTANQSNGMGTAGLLDLQGSFSATGAGLLGVPGDSNSSSPGYFGDFITRTGTPPSGYGRSYANFSGENSESRAGTGNSVEDINGNTISITGNSTSFGADWFNTNGSTIHASAGLSSANLIAQILVTPGSGVSFTGVYGTYGSNGATANFPTYTPPIVSLTGGTTVPPNLTQLIAGTNATFSPSSQSYPNAIIVSGQNGTYAPGYTTVTTTGGLSNGYVEASGFSPADDTEVYALKLDVSGVAVLPTDARLQTIVNDINASSASDGVTASLVTSSPSLALGYFAGYDILLTSNGTTTLNAQDFLGFNFANETNVSGVTVTNIGAVPEPTALALMTAGATGLVARRRRRRRRSQSR